MLASKPIIPYFAQQNCAKYGFIQGFALEPEKMYRFLAA
jgi:hypothetical protein